jgi:hypothetical protein
MKLPILFSEDTVLQLLQSKWSSIINVILDNPSNQASLIQNVSLINGTTTINHFLGRKLKGWRVVGISAAATIYDAQAINQTPQLTLKLVSNAACIIQLEVF